MAIIRWKQHKPSQPPYQRVLEHVRELGLAIGNMIPFRLSQREHHLLQEAQGLVDVLGLFLDHASRLCLYAPFAPSQVYEVELALWKVKVDGVVVMVRILSTTECDNI